MQVKDNLKSILSKIPNGVTLVAVSKTKPSEAIKEAYDFGHRDFGENYVQELVAKSEKLPNDIRWHFIGHLQSNKVKYIAPFVYMIHGVDSLKLLKEINKQAEKFNRTINCLLQLHIAKEETKFGLSYKEADHVLNSPELSTFKNIQIKGFMGMATNTEDESIIRKEFTEFTTYANNYPNLPIKSIGMSSDYLLAIECGGNMIRIGSSIFGNRNYTI
ncbi:MAG: YggS family pyridoxal phosphate-dependent enzyme [Bacteroidia bacterium]